MDFVLVVLFLLQHSFLVADDLDASELKLVSLPGEVVLLQLGFFHLRIDGEELLLELVELSMLLVAVDVEGLVGYVGLVEACLKEAHGVLFEGMLLVLRSKLNLKLLSVALSLLSRAAESLGDVVRVPLSAMLGGMWACS